MGHAKVALNLLKYGAVKCEQTDDVSFIKPTKHAKHNRQGFSSNNMFGGGELLLDLGTMTVMHKYAKLASLGVAMRSRK